MVDRGSLSSGKKSLSCGQAMLKGGLSAAGGAQWSLLLSTFMLSATAALYSAPQARPSCTLGQVAWPGCVAVGISRVAQDVCEPRLFSDTLVVFVGGLRLRGGSGAGGSGADSGMRDDAEEASQLDSEGARESVLANVQSTCFGRSEFFNISVDPDMLVKDLKRELHANFSSLVCDPEQMEVWWSGMELKGLSHDSLRSYGFGQHSTHGGGVVSGSAERLIVKHKFIFSPQFAGESTERQQQRGGMSLGFGGQQAQVAAMHNARMHALLQDPAELNKLMQSPEFKQILASNPEVGEMLKDPEMLRRTMQAATDPAAMRSMLEQQDRMLFNILSQPGGANALKRMTRESAMSASGGGGLGDALLEKMRQQQAGENDEEILSLARLNGQDLDLVLQQLSPDKRAALLRARETLLRNEMGYECGRFKEALSGNASLAREYAALHRRYGTIHQLRQALSANASLASNHSVLAALLRALPTASSSLSAPPSFARNWPGDSSGGDAHGAFAGFDQGFGPGPQRISDDHVQQALKMAMSNMGADSEARGSQTMLQSDADMQDLTQDLVSSPASHLAGASTRKDGDDLADIEQMLADQRSAAESMETSMEAHKQALLDLCCRDPLALASLAVLLQGLTNHQNLSALSPDALGPLQELCSSGASEVMFRELALDSNFMQRILHLSKSPEVERLMSEHPALRHLPRPLMPSTQGTDEQIPASPAAMFKAVYMPHDAAGVKDENEDQGRSDAGAAMRDDASLPLPESSPPLASAHSSCQTSLPSAGSSKDRALGQSVQEKLSNETSDAGRIEGVAGDVKAPSIARQGQPTDGRQVLLQQDGRRIGSKHTNHSESRDVRREQARERARALVEGGNTAISEGDLLRASQLFGQAHEILREVEGASSPAAHKTKALASAMARKAAQLGQHSKKPVGDSQPGRKQAEVSSDDARKIVSPPNERSASDRGGVDSNIHPWEKLPRRAVSMQDENMAARGTSQYQYAPMSWGVTETEGKGEEGLLPEDKDDSFMKMSHALDNAPPPPPEACATDEPARPGEDDERADARAWLAHRHDCTVIANRIVRKFVANGWEPNANHTETGREDHPSKNQATEAQHTPHAPQTLEALKARVSDYTSPPEFILFYHGLNATEMRLALDAPELDYKWVLAQRADEEELRKEAEELAQEEAAQKASEEAEAAARDRDEQVVEPEVKYAAQLSQLKDMGFGDEMANLEALIETGGSVENAITRLIS